MTPTLDATAGWLIAVSWQLLPLTAIVILLDFALRRAGPVVRSALWWMVLAKLIVPPGIASPLSIAQLLPLDAVSAIAAPEAREWGPDSLRSASGWKAQGLTEKSNRASGAATDMAPGHASPDVRSALWWVVLAKLIVPPSIASPPSIAQLWRDAVSAIAAPEAREWGPDSIRGPSGRKDLLLSASSAAAVLPEESNRASGAAVLLLVTWAVGAIAAALLARSRYRRLRAACLDGAELLIDVALDVHDAVAVTAARRLGLSRLPPIFVAARNARAAGLPAVIGFVRPCIVLPRTLLERAPGEIEHVLLHELAHVRRGDPLTSLVCLAAQIGFWFHPAVWCACRRLTTLREMACDRTVARLLGEATPAYRRTLILLARSAAVATAANGTGALGLFQRQSQLVTRLDALARPVSMRRATECAASAAIAAAILVSCVPLARVPAASTVSIDVPPLDQLPGSLQKRYAVMRAMALAEQAQSPPRSR